MNRSDLRALVGLLLVVLVAFAAAMLIVVTALEPPPRDVELLFLYMVGSGSLTVIVIYLLHRRGVLQRLKRLRWLLISLIVTTVLLVFVNVIVTMQLMYISYHDMILTTALLVFAGIIAVPSGIFISETLVRRIRRLGDATQRLGQGQLDTRLPVDGNDELAQVAGLFNRMAEQLEQVDQQSRLLEQSRRDLVAWVSHDLRTPLAAIRAMNEAMLDGVVADAETTRRYRQQIQVELEHLGRLIDDLFDIAQMDAGQITLARKPVRLADSITQTLGRLSARAADKGVAIQNEVDPALPVMTLAQDKIERVLYNLLDNAIHHTPRGGCITIRACPMGKGVSVSVHNTGSVIPPDDLPHVFDRFYRGERSRVQEDRGIRRAGLGLAIARAFVEAHGGTIAVQSSAQNGTIFTFFLL